MHSLRDQKDHIIWRKCKWNNRNLRALIFLPISVKAQQEKSKSEGICTLCSQQLVVVGREMLVLSPVWIYSLAWFSNVCLFDGMHILKGVYLNLLGSIKTMFFWLRFWALLSVMVVYGMPLCRWWTVDHWEKAIITSAPSWLDSASQMCSGISIFTLQYLTNLTAKFKYNHCEQMLSLNNCTFPLTAAARNVGWPFSEGEY